VVPGQPGQKKKKRVCEALSPGKEAGHGSMCLIPVMAGTTK
jgi:hypothetical protein